jgi:hypothetical protein
MGYAKISRVRLRDLTRLGRFRHRTGAAFGARPVTEASRRQSRPKAASSRTGAGDLVA